jgi:pimeloyl-ACP methyl ester carboxylesterase
MAEFSESALSSDDGTRIGYLTAGGGPALVIVHGSFAVAEDWMNVARLLARRRRVFVIDRRGRGRSEDVAPYAFAREVEDVAAMMRHAGPGADLFGHSFGGSVSLAYALLSGFAGALVLYEPPGSFRAPAGGEKLRAVEALLDTGKADEALVLARQTITQLPTAAIEALRVSPFWPAHRSLLRQFIRECRGLDHFAPSAGECARLACRSALLLGSETKRVLKETADALIVRIKELNVVPIPGQGHFCHLLAPEVMAERIETSLAAAVHRNP